MNAKYAVALILALQVSMTLCSIPEPEQELVEKYNQLKSVFYKRLLNAFSKVQAASAPLIEQFGESQQGQQAKEVIENLQSRDEIDIIVRMFNTLSEEMTPLVDRTRSSVLGAYGHYLRPYIGSSLSDTIDYIKVYLDKFLPAE